MVRSPPRKTDTPSTTPAQLARQLVEIVLAAPEEHRRPAGVDDKVLFDVEHQGVRCIVVQLDRQERDDSATERASLSPREMEIARMVAKGYPNKTIASVLEISPWTVGTHLRRMFAKLGVQSRTAMVTHLLEPRSLEPGGIEELGARRADGGRGTSVRGVGGY